MESIASYHESILHSHKYGGEGNRSGISQPRIWRGFTTLCDGARINPPGSLCVITLMLGSDRTVIHFSGGTKSDSITWKSHGLI